jgi:acyl carrier protein phosphodiesterase
MNLLAHAYLSFGNPSILVGNMISDYVKGKQKFLYNPAIQQGIELHRIIDEFTDQHPATGRAKVFFKPAYRLYAGAFVDVVYDHFLANDISLFADEMALDRFAQQTYISLAAYKQIMPERFARMLPYMQAQNWLYNYRYNQGIERSFEGLVRRAAYLDESAVAFSIFEKEYESLKNCYEFFFPELKLLAEKWVTENVQ